VISSAARALYLHSRGRRLTAFDSTGFRFRLLKMRR
jgi:hypothetical protein